MIGKVLEGAGGKFAEEWLPRVLTSSIIFWAGGLGAAIHRFGWKTVADLLDDQSEAIQIAVLILALAIAIASSMIVEHFQFAALRGLEGYWHPIFNRQRRWLVARQLAHRNRIFQEQRSVTKAYKKTPSPELKGQLVQLQDRLAAFPSGELMPTRLGNLLRAAELRPYDKYGLDAIVCWPRLWLLLPDTARGDLSSARAELNAAARLWVWSWLFGLWSLWAWWALPIAVVAAWVAYRWAIAAAQTYGMLIEAAFDFYRDRLYIALRLRLPPDSSQEWGMGRALTEYLRRGAPGTTIYFCARDRGEPASN